MATEAPGVHLVGSVPLEDAATVFRTVSAALGPRIRRLPDGETGSRANWIAWQRPVIKGRPELEPVPVRDGGGLRFRVRAGSSADAVRFEDLGYARAGKESFAIFEQLRESGMLPGDLRFQVCLPTPLAPIGLYIEPGPDQAALEVSYERRLLEELDELMGTIPHDRVALQWDTAIEFGMLEGLFPAWFDDLHAGITERLVRLGTSVPSDVPLGYHLCYGDAAHKHFREPDDMTKLVEVANAVGDALPRPLDWLHMPVPRSRDDEAYFAPLSELRLRPETELFLGLVHLTDGEAGARRRMAAAATVASKFGVATECGWGRREPDTITDLLALHAELADANP
jgi:hypothetical protein